MDLLVDSGAWARWGGSALRCAVGRAGIATDKREGDGATPAGAFALREVLYRPDRGAPPVTSLKLRPLDPADGWCDAPGDVNYNQKVRLPYRASAETLWRADGVYDLIVVLGYNDAPVIAGRGSAIFLHVAQPDFAPTEGCIALGRGDLLRVLKEADATSRIIVTA